MQTKRITVRVIFGVELVRVDSKSLWRHEDSSVTSSRMDCDNHFGLFRAGAVFKRLSSSDETCGDHGERDNDD
jgi:hypothetical protein